MTRTSGRRPTDISCEWPIVQHALVKCCPRHPSGPPGFSAHFSFHLCISHAGEARQAAQGLPHGVELAYQPPEVLIFPEGPQRASHSSRSMPQHLVLDSQRYTAVVWPSRHVVQLGRCDDGVTLELMPLHDTSSAGAWPEDCTHACVFPVHAALCFQDVHPALNQVSGCSSPDAVCMYHGVVSCHYLSGASYNMPQSSAFRILLAHLGS